MAHRPMKPNRPGKAGGGASFAHNEGPTEESIAALLPTSGNGSGSSCHQCKSRRGMINLIYCSNMLVKKSDDRRQACRKKYCEPCLMKFYNELPPDRKDDLTAEWPCPACRGLCSCAACRRGKNKDGDDDDDDEIPVAPPSKSSSGSSSSTKHTAKQPKKDMSASGGGAGVTKAGKSKSQAMGAAHHGHHHHHHPHQQVQYDGHMGGMHTLGALTDPTDHEPHVHAHKASRTSSGGVGGDVGGEASPLDMMADVASSPEHSAQAAPHFGRNMTALALDAPALGGSAHTGTTSQLLQNQLLLQHYLQLQQQGVVLSSQQQLQVCMRVLFAPVYVRTSDACAGLCSMS
jgi:hypothetical protein